MNTIVCVDKREYDKVISILKSIMGQWIAGPNYPLTKDIKEAISDSLKVTEYHLPK